LKVIRLIISLIVRRILIYDKNRLHEICDINSSVELDQVLKDQLSPAISLRLH